MSPRITVVVAAYNRPDELGRALSSVQRQSYDDFECIVVDDASPVDLEPVVAQLDDARFRYIRQSQNGGPYNARLAAYRSMGGEFAVALDSDQEAYPWMLTRAVAYLDEVPSVDGVAGMYVRMSDGCMLVRVESGRKLMTPAEYVNHPAIPDCVGTVRRIVVEEWLQKRTDYFALEAHQWFTFHMRHNQLFVDEPWARMYVDAADRVSERADARILDDYRKFFDEHADDLRHTAAAVLDDLVLDAWLALTRAGRKDDAARYAEILHIRGLSRSRALGERALKKVQKLLSGRAAIPAYRLR